MNGSKASIDEIVKFLNEKGVNPKTGWNRIWQLIYIVVPNVKVRTHVLINFDVERYPAYLRT